MFSQCCNFLDENWKTRCSLWIRRPWQVSPDPPLSSCPCGYQLPWGLGDFTKAHPGSPLVSLLWASSPCRRFSCGSHMCRGITWHRHVPLVERFFPPAPRGCLWDVACVAPGGRPYGNQAAPRGHLLPPPLLASAPPLGLHPLSDTVRREGLSHAPHDCKRTLLQLFSLSILLCKLIMEPTKCWFIRDTDQKTPMKT